MVALADSTGKRFPQGCKLSEPEKEATLAVPYRWWTYQQNEMIGLFIGASAGLPVEAVIVWIAVTYGTTIVYETVKA